MSDGPIVTWSICAAAAAHLDTVLGLIADGTVRPADVTDAVVDWDAAPEAFAAGGGKRVCVRDRR